ncbi:general secretion pathway protein GspE [Stigmatella erecta]|uniref:Type II secretion system (T2SS), protein E, N-terminal domain n=1 Tax=Stigmatella erecta TaxID=83460 RepID=A0A1I0HTF1_9BACT|nr:general secretion pathway protein GspE [Stigmatella erecta]SET87346.1 Type II secretion system (T2SS), protein E, N-terminal domain [Stigmatella erecta]
MAAPQRNRIGELLIKARVIDELQLRSALAQHDQWGGRLSRVIADMGIANEETIINAICQGMGIQRMHLGNVTRDPGALAKVDVVMAEQKGIFPVALKDNGKTLVLAMADPTDLNTVDQVVAKSRTRVIVVIAGDKEIENAILRHYRGQEPNVSTRYTESDTAAPDSSGEEEFKVVDMSGKTVVKRIADIAPSQAAPSSGGGGASAGDLLDEILSGGAPSASLTPEEMQRLQAVQQNQEKSSKILRALLELLLEKGALSQKELASRMRS